MEITGENGRQVSTPITLRDPNTGKSVHQFDTWIYAPVAPGTFDIVVGTAPRIKYSSRALEKDTTYIIQINTGALRVELMDANNKRINAPVELRDQRTGALLRSFNTWYNQIALPGTYDVVVDAANPVTRKGIRIETDKLTIISVGMGLLRVELLGVGGDRIKSLVDLQEPGTARPARSLATWQDHQVPSGTYQLSVHDVLGTIPAQLKIESGETMVMKLSSGLLRVELTEKGQVQVAVPAALVDPKTGNTVGQFTTGQDQQVLEGDYQLVIKAKTEIKQPVKVEGGKHAVIKLESAG